MICLITLKIHHVWNNGIDVYQIIKDFESNSKDINDLTEEIENWVKESKKIKSVNEDRIVDGKLKTYNCLKMDNMTISNYEIDIIVQDHWARIA